MRYVILMYADPARTQAMTPDELAEMGEKHRRLRDELVPAGEIIGGAGLVLPDATTWLRWEGPEGTGPLVPGREQITAYYELECSSAERVREIAAGLLDFHVTAVELRPVHDWVGRDD